jgi:flagellar biosynthesis/type III secretory pathway protein FliH
MSPSRLRNFYCRWNFSPPRLGIIAGRRAAEDERNIAAEEQASATKTLLQMISNHITFASEAHQRFLKSQHTLVQKLSLAIARKVAGDALKREPMHSVEALVKECVALFAGNERIMIFVAAQKYEGLKQSIDTIKPLLKDFQGEIIIEGDDSLQEHDCRVEWKSGEALFSEELLWSEIDQIVKKTVLS